MGRIKEIVIDADHPAVLARFWAAAIEGYRIRDYDTEEIARLAALGLTPETDPSVMVDGTGPTLCFQLRKGPRPERNRIHFDLSTADRTSEVAQLTALGATVWKETEAFTVLRDPEGNQFCVVETD